MSTDQTPHELPSFPDIIRSVALVPMGIVISTTALPGFLFCVPALIFALLFIAIPLVAVLALALVATAVVAVPVGLVWAVRRASRPWPARERETEPRPIAVASPARAGGDAAAPLAALRMPSVRRP
jgi:hypothetical protein